MTTTPDVSIVVIVYNDAERLPRAVDSVLGQTLHNLEVLIVDDASTDGSFAVAEALAARHSDRVRAIRLDHNSGGCSRPRNVGIDAARGTYVMFLDSDDTLERHACKNILETAEETGADLVSGMCVRVHMSNRGPKITKWYPNLYREHAVHDSLGELPDLLYDTLSTNKCYLRTFLDENSLRFPEGFHYEDLLFSAQAYIAAERIALIPFTVYNWYVDERAETKSISNRRDEIGNFVDRVRIHEMIDLRLAECLPADQARALKTHKDKKFIRHDLVLYLWGLPFQDETYRNEFHRLARGYLETLDPIAFTDCSPIPAIAAYLLLRGDHENLPAALDTLLNRNKLAAPLHREGGRQETPGGAFDQALVFEPDQRLAHGCAGDTEPLAERRGDQHRAGRQLAADDLGVNARVMVAGTGRRGRVRRADVVRRRIPRQPRYEWHCALPLRVSHDGIRSRPASNEVARHRLSPGGCICIHLTSRACEWRVIVCAQSTGVCRSRPGRLPRRAFGW